MIKYRSGLENVVADSLSRIPIMSVSTPVFPVSLLEDISKGYESDKSFSEIFTSLSTGSQPSPTIASVLHRYKLVDKFLYKLDDPPRLCIPRVPAVLSQLLKEFHDSPLAGHFGFEKTYSAVSKICYWPKMDKTIRAYVSSCDACQRDKPSNTPSPGLAYPLDVPDSPWHSVSLDFVGPLPLTTSGFDFILVIVDRLSKMAHFVPTTTKVTGKDAAILFLNRVVSLHGLPRNITSDRDPRFVGNFWKSLFAALGTTLNMSTAYHAQTNGQTERTNRTLEEYLRHYVKSKPQAWDEFLPLAEFAYNNSKQASTGFSPFELCYTHKPMAPIDFLSSSPITVPAVDSLLDTIKSQFMIARDRIHEAQTKQSSYSNNQHTSKVFKSGDLVLLDAAHIDSPHSSSLPSTKFKPRWLGPFKILEVKRVTAKLEIPSTMKFHDTFHFSKLKHFDQNDSVQFPNRSVEPPPPIQIDNSTEFEVESITAKRSFRGKTQYLVNWKGYGPDDATWEPISNLSNAQEAVRKFEQVFKRGGMQQN